MRYPDPLQQLQAENDELRAELARSQRRVGELQEAVLAAQARPFLVQGPVAWPRVAGHALVLTLAATVTFLAVSRVDVVGWGAVAMVLAVVGVGLGFYIHLQGAQRDRPV